MLLGVDGKKYQSGETKTGKTQIDLSTNSVGLYFLILTDKSGKQVDQFKLVKTIP